MAKNKVVRPLRVEVPKAGKDRPVWGRVGAFAAAGLLIGVAWPKLAGMSVAPRVPGANKPAASAGALPATPSEQPTVPAALTAPPKASNAQTVVVSKGRVAACWKNKKRVEPEFCGALRIDPTLIPRLQALATCPSAMGMSGELGFGFDINFKTNEIRVVRGKRGKAPATTVNGIIACMRDYLSDVTPEKLPHKYQRYKVSYTLEFFPPGTGPAVETSDGSAEHDDDNDPRGFATVSHHTALVRDEPRTGKIVARLVRGTRVKILSRRKDWYRVRIRSTEGWVHRGAIGM